MQKRTNSGVLDIAFMETYNESLALYIVQIRLT